MAICPTCGKTFDERSFHVLASGQAFDTAECALLALEAANPEIGLAGLPAPAGLGPFARPGRSAMMRSMRARLPFGLLVAALAASAILSAYLWLRALGAGPTPPVRPLSLMPAERRSVETLPGIVYHAPATARRTEARKHPAQARAAARRRPSPPRVVETSAATPPTAQLVSAPVPRSTPAPSPAPSPPPSPSPKPKPSPAPPSPAPPAPTPPAPTPSPSPPQPAPSPPPVPTPPSPEPAAAAVPPSPAPAPQNSPPESQPASTPPSSESSKPGWGCGDKNHSHSGPPGNGGGNGSPC